MSTIAKQIDRVLRAGCAPILKSSGFQKEGRTWRRTTKFANLIVNAQASQWNFGEKGTFTFNLGAYFPAVADLVGASPIQKLREYDCFVRTRIGQLMPDGRDYWWSIDGECDESGVSKVALEVEAALRTTALPWLDLVSTYEGALADRRIVHGLARIALLLLVGRKMEAQGAVSRSDQTPHLLARARELGLI